VTPYETATKRAGLPPWLPAGYARVLAWRTRPELCARCHRRAADILEGTQALCRGCHTTGRGDAATRQRQHRQAAIEVSLRQDDTGRGVVGLAVPFGEPVELKAGHWEQFERGAFRYSPTLVPLTRSHGGPEIARARAFELPHGLFFEASDLRHQADVLRGASLVSIAFDRDNVQSTYESFRGGRLRRIHEARLSQISLVASPAYRMTWAAARTPEAWQKVYRGMQAALDRIVEECA